MKLDRYLAALEQEVNKAVDDLGLQAQAQPAPYNPRKVHINTTVHTSDIQQVYETQCKQSSLFPGVHSKLVEVGIERD